MNPELNILEALQSSYPRGLREAVLNADLRNAGHKISLTDQQRHCRNLETKGHVTLVSGQDHTFVKITPDGLGRLSE